jgi:uncharacterized integral membrane protein (TIGR00698 family)
MTLFKKYPTGILLAVVLAFTSTMISEFIPYHLISAGVFALIIGMLLNPLIIKYDIFSKGLEVTSKKILRLAIILMGAGLNLSQVVEVGKFSLIVMICTLIAAFGGGYLIGNLFRMSWKLSSLISAGTGICGGSAIAAIAPVIDAEESDIAYAISATFIFDIIMVIIFPIMGHFFKMTDLGYGLWAGTAVNDTSSVVAAGYAFSDAAGNLAVIVKLTRTLSIVPVVLIFSYINERIIRRSKMKTYGKNHALVESKNRKIDFNKVFPWFILLFLLMVIIKSIGIITDGTSQTLSNISKFMMVMALGSIGLRTNFSKLSKSGFIPMLHGFIISAFVVVVSFFVQMVIGVI